MTLRLMAFALLFSVSVAPAAAGEEGWLRDQQRSARSN